MTIRTSQPLRLSPHAQLLLAIVRDGTKLNFGMNAELFRHLPRDARMQCLEEITRLLLWENYCN